MIIEKSRTVLCEVDPDLQEAFEDLTSLKADIRHNRIACPHCGGVLLRTAVWDRLVDKLIKRDRNAHV